MTNGGAALDVLIAETDRAIHEIEGPATKVGCDAHAPLARGVVLLLRWQKAQAAQKQQIYRIATITSAIVAGVVIGLARLPWSRLW